jgi:GTP pyrophosphokinase
LIDGIRAYHPDPDLALLEELRVYLAEDFRMGGTVEKTGVEVPGIVLDPIEVALILARMRLDIASIAAGLLVDRAIHRQLDLKMVERRFGRDVAFLTRRVTDISLASSQARTFQAEDLRKMVLAMAKDVRVILIRLAMCLQQLRVLVDQQESSPHAQYIAKRVLDIYAPIGHRLGIHWIKSALEDHAFHILNPTAFQEVSDYLEQRRQGGGDVVHTVVAFFEEKLKAYEIEGKVFGREKHAYSVWGKLSRKNLNLDELFDLIGYRIIVESKADCYRALGMIHSELVPIPGRFKDYVALPKSNGYQSLHTVVFGPFGNRIEIQIRTRQMHEVAESGVAAHWVYKGSGIESRQAGRTGYAWLKTLLEIHQSADDPRQFLENVRIDLFPDEIYIFTPRGEIVTLPRGSTPVDFAYAVHSAVGDHCQGCRINNRMVPLRTPLNTGDTVEILTHKNSHPNANWLQFVVTGKAKYRIARWMRDNQRLNLAALGRELLEREARKLGRGLEVNDETVGMALPSLGLERSEELFFQVGSNRLSAVQVLHRMFPELASRWTAGGRNAPVTVLKETEECAGPEQRGTFNLSGNLRDLAVKSARCCLPVPGDDVEGIIITGTGISLHRRDCPNLRQYKSQPERRIDSIDWPVSRHTYVARLILLTRRRQQAPAQITQAVNEAQSVIRKLSVRDRQRDPSQIVLDLEVTGLEQLTQVMQRLDKLEAVERVVRPPDDPMS